MTKKTKSRVKSSVQSKTKHNHKKNISNEQKSRLVKNFFEILHTIKLYHWKTKSYSEHKSTDELHEKLAEDTDRFIEVLLGKTASRIDMVEHNIRLYDFDNTQDFKHKLFEFRQFLIDLHQIFPTKRDVDLMNIKDDMLYSVNRFLYTLTLA